MAELLAFRGYSEPTEDGVDDFPERLSRKRVAENMLGDVYKKTIPISQPQTEEMTEAIDIVHVVNHFLWGQSASPKYYRVDSDPPIIIGKEPAVIIEPEIVRCGQCNYLKTIKVNDEDLLICQVLGMQMEEDDYCSCGGME